MIRALVEALSWVGFVVHAVRKKNAEVFGLKRGLHHHCVPFARTYALLALATNLRGPHRDVWDAVVERRVLCAATVRLLSGARGFPVFADIGGFPIDVLKQCRRARRGCAGGIRATAQKAAETCAGLLRHPAGQ